VKIERLELRLLKLPLVHFFETSFGRIDEKHFIIVRVDGEGATGFGECVAEQDPYYSAETNETCWHIIADFIAPRVLGATFGHPRELFPALKAIRGHNMAKAAVEMAAWDLYAKQRGEPLGRVLGGTRDRIASGVSIGIQRSLDDLAATVERELAAGYRRIKIKVKPGWDVNILEKVRARWSDITLSVDANSAYTLDEFEHLRKFDQFNLLMIEQPLWNDDIYYHARLQKELRTAICLDESIEQARDAACAVETGACRVINIKVGRVGGFTEAKKVHDVCQANNVPVWCGGMLESGIGRMHNVAVSTLDNFRLPGDVSASRRYWKEDIIEPEVEVSREGLITIRDEPGTGYRVREDLIEKLTVKKETIQT